MVLAIPAGRLLDSRFRATLTAGGSLTAAGALLRLGGPSFGWALAGQTAVAVAQPLVLSAIGKFAAAYMPPARQPAGIAVASAAGFVGMLAALLLGPTIGGDGHVERLLVVEAILAVLAALSLGVALRRPTAREELSATIEGHVVRRLWALPAMRDMCGLVFVGFGVFVAIATWLQTLLEPAGVSEGTAGALLAGMVLTGIVGCTLLPAPIDRRHAERSFLRLAVLTSICGSAALAAIPAFGARAGVLAAMGFVLLPALPVVLTVTERLAGPVAGTAGALVWMAGNLGGLVVALIVQALVHHPSAAFLSMAAISILGLPLATRFQPAPGEPLLERQRA